MTYIEKKVKKEFIEFFTSQFEQKPSDPSLFFLQCLSKHDVLLERVRFVEDINNCPLSLVINTLEDQGKNPIILYHYNNRYTTTDKISETIWNSKEDIYIKIIFSEKHSYNEYYAILDNNPYSRYEKAIMNGFRGISEIIIDSIPLIKRRMELKDKIDEALSKRDKESFYTLTEELKKIEIPSFE